MQPFTSNSRVCFFGDSIIQGGVWIRRVYDYYLQTAKIKCEMYNLGIGGNSSIHGYSRLNQIYELNPTDVVIMFGMNDVNYPAFSVKPISKSEIDTRRRCRDENFSYYEKICKSLIKHNIKIHLCTPTSYDELSEGEAENFIGTCGALKEFANRITYISKKYNCDVIDFNGMMFEAQKKAFITGNSYIGNDRIHPNVVGNELMARFFLSEQGFPIEFSNDYETVEKQSKIPYSEWEEKRYELELKAKSNFFLRYQYFWKIKDDKKLYNKTKVALETHEAKIWGNSAEYIESQFREFLKEYPDEKSVSVGVGKEKERFNSYVEFVKTALK